MNRNFLERKEDITTLFRLHFTQSSGSYWKTCTCVLSRSSCPTLCNPTACSPPGSSLHGILQARTLDLVAMPCVRGSSQLRDQTRISCLLHWLLLLLSCLSRVRLCATPETAAHQTPPSLGFSRQEHWSGLPFPSPTQESER